MLKPKPVAASMLFLSFAPALAAAADDAKDKKGPTAEKTDQELIQGTWRVTGMVRDGQEMPEEQLKADAASLRFDGETATMIRGKGDEKVEKPAAFKLDPGKTPKQIAVTPREGDGPPMTGLYELKGDTLKIVFRIGEESTTPPDDFKQGKGFGMMILERQNGVADKKVEKEAGK